MPGMYAPEDYDIAGFTVGAVEKDNLIDGSKVAVGDVLVGLPSTGVHSNGFSLVRKVVKDGGLDLNAKYPETGEKTLGETLLTPTAIYVRPVLDLMKSVDIHGVAHITGGGFDENIPRILAPGMGVEVEEGSWKILPIFNLLERVGGIPHREMFNIYNMGIGMVLAMNADAADKAIELLSASGINARKIGKVITGAGVTIK
jgi:phosphoribosylformylglycinamidine cyclo-ligase